jgi:hypothetical protein
MHLELLGVEKFSSTKMLVVQMEKQFDFEVERSQRVQNWGNLNLYL